MVQNLHDAAKFAVAAHEALVAYEADLGEALPEDHEIGRIEDSRGSPSFRIRVGHIRHLADAALAAAEPGDAELVRCDSCDNGVQDDWTYCPYCGAQGRQMVTAIPISPRDPGAESERFQPRVGKWMSACFGEAISRDLVERNHRFIEESLELVQANGCTKSEAHQLVDYVFSRPVGELQQEAGGVMVTLAALCLASDIHMDDCGEIELTRVWSKVAQIRAKQAAKPKHSPLPESAIPARGEADAGDEKGVLNVHTPSKPEDVAFVAGAGIIASEVEWDFSHDPVQRRNLIAMTARAYDAINRARFGGDPGEKIKRAENERDWQYEENVSQIARIAALEAQLTKPEPNPEWEAKADAYHAALVAEHGVEPRETLRMLERWKADAEPVNELGQFTFSRAMLDSATDALRFLLDDLKRRDNEIAQLEAQVAADAEHFEGIAHKAQHWASVFAKNELAEERWVQIRNHARHRATLARAAFQPRSETP